MAIVRIHQGAGGIPSRQIAGSARSLHLRRRNGAGGYLVTCAEVLLVALSAAYVTSGSPEALVAWMAAASTYLLVGFWLVRRQSLQFARARERVGALESLSWMLPLAASAAGINAAIWVLARMHSTSAAPRAELAIAGSLGIILSWLLLHTGFARIYGWVDRREPRLKRIAFPSRPSPMIADYLYFSFTIGTAFATSDSVVHSVRVRLVVLVHSIISFLYNALVVAVAFQVLQQLVEN